MNPTRNPIRDVIRRRGALVIDGAMSTALEKLGMVLNDSLWSARALVANEDLVRQVHLDYFRAGANAAITDSYQATEAGFAARGFSCSDARRFIRRSAELAGEARDLILAENRSLAREDLLVAGAVGPYGAFLADGSEYTGRYALSRDEYARFHRMRIDALLEGGADVLAVETQPRFDEVSAVLSMIEDRDVTAWVTVTLNEAGTMPDGTPLAKLARELDANPHAAALGLNCVRREKVEAALAELAAHTDKPLVVYPNSGEVYDPVTKTWGQGPHANRTWSTFVPKWRALGAACIGGCCRTLPGDVREISAILAQQAPSAPSGAAGGFLGAKLG